MGLGLITNDAAIARLPRELAVLLETRLKLVIADSAGHDPLRATGLVFAHLPQICEGLQPDKAQVWTLRAAPKSPQDPWDLLQPLASREGMSPRELFKRHRPTHDQMETHPLTGRRRRR